MTGGCCCCCRDKTKVSPEEEPYGPLMHRRCRDVFFLLLFLVFWAGMITIAAIAFKEGDINRLDHGTDMDGNMCGEINRAHPLPPPGSSESDAGSSASVFVGSEDVDMRAKPFLYWPTPLDRSIQLCVAECPPEMPTITDLTELLMPGTLGDAARQKLICKYDVTWTPTITDVIVGDCWPKYKSMPVLGRCVPDFTNFTAVSGMWTTFFGNAGNESRFQNMTIPTGYNSSVANEVTVGEALKLLYKAVNAKEAFNQAVAEITASWKQIVGLCAASIVVAFLFVLVLRFFAGFIVWMSILLCLLALVGLTAFAWRLSEVLQARLPADPALQNPNDVTRIKVAKGFTYGLIVIDSLFLVIVVALRKRIALAVGIIKESGKCLSAIPSIISFPIIICLWHMMFYAYWVAVSLMLATASVVPKNSIEIRGYKIDHGIRWFSLYHLFGLFWTTELINAIGQTSLAMAVARWYWTIDKKEIPRGVVFRSVLTVLRYHLGSLAFGSLIIAIIQFIRAMLRYVEKQLKGKMDYRIVRWIMFALKCCFWLLEKILKFINKNAYIMIAIKGDGFCASARRAFELIFSNILRVGTVNAISAFLLFLMRVFVATTCALVTAIILENQGLKFWFVPVVIVWVVSYAVAFTFTSVYAMAIDTILLSFCEDSSRNDGSAEKPYYMSPELRAFVDSHVKAKKADEQKKAAQK